METPCIPPLKILHRLLNVKEYLKKCNLEPEDDCPFCDEVESIEHVFLYCSYNDNFFNKCISWIDNIVEVSFQISPEEILFTIKKRKLRYYHRSV